MSDQTQPAPQVFDFHSMHAGLEQFLKKDLFFIGGFPKSGTTWLQVMLNAHPDISCRGEGHFLNRLAPELKKALMAHNDVISIKNKAIFNELPPFPIFDNAQYLYLLTASIALAMSRSEGTRAARLVGEKTPNNVMHFPMLAGMFPRAKFLHVVRDGRDCLVSAWFHTMRTNPQALLARYETFDKYVVATAPEWKMAAEAGGAFAAARPDRCATVRYIDLTRHPRDALIAILRFLGADTADAILDTCLSEGAFETMSGGRPRGVEDRNSLMRQGLPGDWRNHFSETANRAFLDIAGETMARFGYRDETTPA